MVGDLHWGLVGNKVPGDVLPIAMAICTHRGISYNEIRIRMNKGDMNSDPMCILSGQLIPEKLMPNKFLIIISTSHHLFTKCTNNSCKALANYLRNSVKQIRSSKVDVYPRGFKYNKKFSNPCSSLVQNLTTCCLFFGGVGCLCGTSPPFVKVSMSSVREPHHTSMLPIEGSSNGNPKLPFMRLMLATTCWSPLCMVCITSIMSSAYKLVT